jgi:hypothetical protein
LLAWKPASASGGNTVVPERDALGGLMARVGESEQQRRRKAPQGAAVN